MRMPKTDDLNAMATLVAGCSFYNVVDPNNRARIIELCLMGEQVQQTLNIAEWLGQIDTSMTIIHEWFEKSDTHRRF